MSSEIFTNIQLFCSNNVFDQFLISRYSLQWMVSSLISSAFRLGTPAKLWAANCVRPDMFIWWAKSNLFTGQHALLLFFRKQRIFPIKYFQIFKKFYLLIDLFMVSLKKETHVFYAKRRTLTPRLPRIASRWYMGKYGHPQMQRIYMRTFRLKHNMWDRYFVRQRFRYWKIMRVFQRFASRYRRSSYNDFYKRFLLEFRVNAQLTESLSKQTFSSNGALVLSGQSGKFKNFVKKQFLNVCSLSNYIPPVSNISHNLLTSRKFPLTSNIFVWPYHSFTKFSSINLLMNLRITSLSWFNPVAFSKSLSLFQTFFMNNMRVVSPQHHFFLSASINNTKIFLTSFEKMWARIPNGHYLSMLFIAHVQNLPAYLQIERWNKIIMLFHKTRRFFQPRQHTSKFRYGRLPSLRKVNIIKKKKHFGATFFMQINSWAYGLRMQLRSHPLWKKFTYRGAARFYHRQLRKHRVSIWAFFRSYQLQRIGHLMSLLQDYPFFHKRQHSFVRRRKWKKKGRKWTKLVFIRHAYYRRLRLAVHRVKKNKLLYSLARKSRKNKMLLVLRKQFLLRRSLRRLLGQHNRIGVGGSSSRQLKLYLPMKTGMNKSKYFRWFWRAHRFWNRVQKLQQFDVRAYVPLLRKIYRFIQARHSIPDSLRQNTTSVWGHFKKLFMRFNTYFRVALLLKRYYKILCRLFDAVQIMCTSQLVTKTRLTFLNSLLGFRKKWPSNNSFSILTNNFYFKSLLNWFKHSSLVITRLIASSAFRTSQRHFFKTVSLLGPMHSSCLRQWFAWRNFTLILSLRLSVILNTICWVNVLPATGLLSRQTFVKRTRKLRWLVRATTWFLHHRYHRHVVRTFLVFSVCLKFREFFLFLKQLGFLFTLMRHRKFQRGVIRLYKLFVQSMRSVSNLTQMNFSIAGKFNRRPRARTILFSRTHGHRPAMSYVRLRIIYSAYELKTFFGTYFLRLWVYEDRYDQNKYDQQRESKAVAPRFKKYAALMPVKINIE